MSNQYPLVSVGIPLYKSLRFLDIITANIEAIDYPNVEIIISDRHYADNTIDLLGERFKQDARCKFYKAADEINWPEHFNFLLEVAQGQYFCWMAHDDTFPSGYVSKLVACLEENPNIVLAYGELRPIDLNGQPVQRNFLHELPVAPNKPWTITTVVKLLAFRYLEPQFRGLFRRDVVMHHKHFIRSTGRTVGSDTYWVFGLALLGPFQYVHSCFCQKRFYSDSTHVIQWEPHPEFKRIIDGFVVTTSYLRDYVASPIQAWYGYTLICIYSLMRVVLVGLRLSHIPPRLRRSIYDLAERYCFRSNRVSQLKRSG